MCDLWETEPYRKDIKVPDGWHMVSLRSQAMLNLMQVRMPGTLRPDQVVMYNVGRTRDMARSAALRVKHELRSRGGGGITWYVGRNFMCADFYFERAQDAMLFKLAHS